MDNSDCLIIGLLILALIVICSMSSCEAGKRKLAYDLVSKQITFQLEDQPSGAKIYVFRDIKGRIVFTQLQLGPR